MKKTLYEANGVGLAAPQIAVSKRIFVADDGESGFEAYINPEWQPDGDEMATDSEGCLSVPGLFGEVTRYARVIVRYQDIHGKKKVKKASGLLARCIQHETDLLNGILFIEKAISLHKGPKDDEYLSHRIHGHARFLSACSFCHGGTWLYAHRSLYAAG